MEKVICPRCNKGTPAEKYENRYYNEWHYFCVHCRHHWTPEKKNKLDDIVERIEVIEVRLGIKGD